ncbi:MAG: hypothetical protein OEY30_01790 [Candidatus Bathyarchaeota archaeon]|nr:hypothetical protein [Candidatus Bathyarchaeota archaeon]
MSIWAHLNALKKKVGQLATEVQALREDCRRLNSCVTFKKLTGKEVREIELLNFLPEPTRRTYVVLRKLGVADAEAVSTLTGRSRAVESMHLNFLALFGAASKTRKGRRVFFQDVWSIFR